MAEPDAACLMESWACVIRVMSAANANWRCLDSGGWDKWMFGKPVEHHLV